MEEELVGGLVVGAWLFLTRRLQPQCNLSVMKRGIFPNGLLSKSNSAGSIDFEISADSQAWALLYDLVDCLLKKETEL